MGNIRYKGGNYTRSARPVLIEKEITANGTYLASDDEADGYKKVVVDVPPENNSNMVYSGEYTAFTFTRAIEKLYIPEGFIQPSSWSIFQNATSLKEIYTPSTFGSNSLDIYAFSGCTALEKIVINKSEGSISRAPWGAPSSCEIIWNG